LTEEFFQKKQKIL